MKKLISLTLALLLVFSLATVAGATPAEEAPAAELPYINEGTNENIPKITKTYIGYGSGVEKSPAETFEFENLTAFSVEKAATGVTKNNMPMISIGTAEFDANAATAAGTSKDIVITVPGVSSTPDSIVFPAEDERFTTYPSVGIYTYTFNEKDNGTAGVEYYSKTMTVVVSVVMGDDGLLRVAGVHCENPAIPNYEPNSTKTDVFVNTYAAGSLDVKKEVTGLYGDTSKPFAFEVTFTAPDGDTVKSDIGYSLGGTTQTAISFYDSDTEAYKNSVTVQFNLKDGDTASFTNIPTGVTYTVKEVLESGSPYTTTYSLNEAAAVTGTEYSNGMIVATKNDEGAITKVTSDSIVFTNDYDGDVDTGITLDSIPFILILAVCAGAVVLFVVKRRRSVDF